MNQIPSSRVRRWLIVLATTGILASQLLTQVAFACHGNGGGC